MIISIMRVLADGVIVIVFDPATMLVASQISERLPPVPSAPFESGPRSGLYVLKFESATPIVTVVPDHCAMIRIELPATLPDENVSARLAAEPLVASLLC